MRGRKTDERNVDASVVMMTMMKEQVDRDRALCMSSIATNVQFPTISVCLSVSIELITFPQATSGSKLRSYVTSVVVCVYVSLCVYLHDGGRQICILGRYILRKHAQKPHKKRQTLTNIISSSCLGGDS